MALDSKVPVALLQSDFDGGFSKNLPKWKTLGDAKLLIYKGFGSESWCRFSRQSVASS
jgi:hypothetical protein